MTPAKPTVGRIVLFVLPDSVPNTGQVRAALVTGAFGGMVANLRVLCDQIGDVNDDKRFYPDLRVWSAPYDETGAPGTWHWMEYQRGQQKKTEELEQKLAEVSTPTVPTAFSETPVVAPETPATAPESPVEGPAENPDSAPAPAPSGE